MKEKVSNIYEITSTKLIICFLFVAILFVTTSLASSVIASDYQLRTAIVVDTSGMTSEVKELNVEGEYKDVFANIFSSTYSHGIQRRKIVVNKKPFYLGIPLSSIISIDVKKKTCTVKYSIGDQEREISGEFIGFGAFSGKTDFGDFKLDMNKLKKLTFKEPPSAAKSETEANKLLTYDTTLFLKNGKRLPVGNFERLDYYCSSAGYIMGCGDRYEHLDDFRFMRGESLQTVPFKDIRTIEFSNTEYGGLRGDLAGSVTVTLKNGKSAIGKLTDEHGAGVDWYTGFYENGDFEFCMSPQHVKTIQFMPDQK